MQRRMHNLLARMFSDAHSMLTWPDSRHGFTARENRVTRAHQYTPVQSNALKTNAHGRASATAKFLLLAMGKIGKNVLQRQN